MELDLDRVKKVAAVLVDADPTMTGHHPAHLAAKVKYAEAAIRAWEASAPPVTDEARITEALRIWFNDANAEESALYDPYRRDMAAVLAYADSTRPERDGNYPKGNWSTCPNKSCRRDKTCLYAPCADRTRPAVFEAQDPVHLTKQQQRTMDGALRSSLRILDEGPERATLPEAVPDGHVRARIAVQVVAGQIKWACLEDLAYKPNLTHILVADIPIPTVPEIVAQVVVP